ncbi:MAG: DoxX family protein [Janthinobacterium lividum]
MGASPAGLAPGGARRCRWLRLGLALLFVGAGVLHFVHPAPFLRIVPPALPAPRLLVLLSGVAEVAGGLGLLLPATRRLAGWGLLALLVAVFPANVYMVGLASALHIPAWVLWARLPLQPLLGWAVWRASQYPAVKNG